ncbi:Scavenger receptor cysteine-rich type 1 protein M130 [Schistosoma japonicum]|nr:Scavenger receptor cysteine-rich type 1 protein M130 [Schistosoma japonicum]
MDAMVCWKLITMVLGGTICNIGFDELAASVACFMLGFPPRGVPILNSRRYSPNSAPLLSEFNCTGRVLLSSGTLSTATTHLGVCSFTTELPTVCLVNSRQTSIVCLDPMETTTTTTPTPNYMTLAPVSCDTPSNSSVRLVGGTVNSGRVEVKHPQTNEWGTICGDGFDLNAARALCRMLCTSSDNLQYAYPVLYLYGSASNSTPIHLSRLECSSNASSLNDCKLGGGWGSAPGCTHGMDIGLQCGPPVTTKNPDVYHPEFYCNQTTATVIYDKVYNPDLNSSMIRLDQDPLPVDCQYRVNDNTTHILAFIPLVGCGGSLTLSNSTSIAINLSLIRTYLTPENGVVSKLPMKFTVTCLIPRSNQIHSEVVASPNITTNLLYKSENINSTLKLYRDQLFTVQLQQPITIPPGNKVYALVSLVNPQKTSKLILEYCWATATPSRNSTPKRNLIVDRCASLEDLTVIPSSATQVGFTFNAFYLNTAGSEVPIYSNLYLHCDIRVCDLRETSTNCQQYCQFPLPPQMTTTTKTTVSNEVKSLRRYRRDSKFMSQKFLKTHGRIHVDSGQVLIV